MQIFGVAASGNGKGSTLLHNRNAKGGHAVFIPHFADHADVLTEILDELHPVPDVSIRDVATTTEPRQGMLSYLHKQKNGINIYYLANSTADNLTPTIQLRGEHLLECWNPHNGETRTVETKITEKSGQLVTQLQFPLPAMQSLFLIDMGHA